MQQDKEEEEEEEEEKVEEDEEEEEQEEEEEEKEEKEEEEVYRTGKKAQRSSSSARRSRLTASLLCCALCSADLSTLPRALLPAHICTCCCCPALPAPCSPILQNLQIPTLLLLLEKKRAGWRAGELNVNDLRARVATCPSIFATESPTFCAFINTCALSCR